MTTNKIPPSNIRVPKVLDHPGSNKQQPHQPPMLAGAQPAQVTGPVGPHHPRKGKNPKNLNKIQNERLSLTEAAKLVYNGDLNGTGINSKTPVSVLQELLSRRGITPKYELLQIEGAIHEPVFRYRVFLNTDFVATGTGRSKKDAKHAAAKNLLDLLVGKVTSEQANQANGAPGATDITAQVVSPFDDKVMGNPIGWLQEMCMSRRWPPPFYEMENEEGLPHERQFTIACQVLSMREIGTGKSKKLAKRFAAHKMWQALQDLPMEGNNLPGFDSDEDTVNLSAKDFNFVNFLQEIASEQNFEVTYVDIEEKSLTGRCQCLVQLSTLPVAVCFGVGKTPKDAQSNAAHNALEYLKIMTKK
ncbi:RISC-loading complex subunit tarbp2-like isoform X3 [Anthonomus grandis grandis]|uniref:RISC-loading complex subunit tarbp2-like isoform X3 n=1 Tax=Anthonomus grandis grandis TaxID=2921223 RepID=UPI0021653ABD|nr:RISC-loading complex subunit tarbp2-like isoform X3 [Anthonomus grandis grandis]